MANEKLEGSRSIISAMYQDAATRLFSRDNLRTLIETEVANGVWASVQIDDKTGSLFFVYGHNGMAFNPKVGAWSAPLDFSNCGKTEGNIEWATKILQ